MVDTFYNPVTTYFGKGSLCKLKELTENETVTLVTFPEAESLGLIEKIKLLLGDRLVHIIQNVQPNPDVIQLKEIYEYFWEKFEDCDTVLAIGGGSSIDTAKALIVGTESKKFEELLEPLVTGKKFTPTKYKKLIAVPTTAGTGSEVTPWATIWDSKEQKKYSLHLDCTWPKVAIIDPDLMLTVPRAITISTGLDALSHALESIWNVNSNPVSDIFAISAIEDILDCLPKLSQDLLNENLRSKMALAALKAGMAFSNTKTALAHSISYEMTLRYGLAHGIACSFTLPYVLGLAWGTSKSRDQIFKKLFGNSLEDAQTQLLNFLHSLDVKTEFCDYGVYADEQMEMINYAMQGARGKNFIGVSLS